MMISTTAMAKLPPTAFNYVTQYFKHGKEAYSPVLGEIGLQSGLIESIRFYGPFTPAFKSGQRDYANDSSSDPLWNTVFSLFLLANGTFSSDRNMQNNIGRYVKDPKFVAKLLNFAHNVREGKIKEESDLKPVEIALKESMDRPHRSVFSGKNPQITKLLCHIKDSIYNEEKSLFPKYNTEKVIESFFPINSIKKSI